MNTEFLTTSLSNTLTGTAGLGQRLRVVEAGAGLGEPAGALLSPETSRPQGDSRRATSPRDQPDVVGARRGAASRVARRERLVAPSAAITGMQKWDGRVVDLVDGMFTAELEPSEGGGAPVWADFDVSLLGPDADSIGVGDLIYVTVRTVTGRAGYQSRTASLRLRRLGQWTVTEIASVQERANLRRRELDAYID